MAKKKICPEPVRRTGGAATPCTPCGVSEDWCYRLQDDPAGTTRPGKHTYDVDAQCARSNEKFIGDDGAEIDPCTVIEVMCGQGNPPPTEPPEPPEPLTLDGQDCDGAALPATGNPGELVQIVQPPGQVLSVRFCSEDNADFELSCGVDPLTGHQIQTAYKIVAGEFVLIKRWDTVTGTEWTGDPATLEGCGGKPLEAEQELFCDNGVEFLRWYTIEDGVPTGQYIDTDFTGAPYTVTDESGIKRGACVAEVLCEPTISSAPGDTLAGLLPGHSIAIQKAACCVIKVTTSAGSFIVRKGMTAYSTADFACPVTVTAVEVLEGKCTAADVIVTTQKLS